MLAAAEVSLQIIANQGLDSIFARRLDSHVIFPPPQFGRSGRKM